MEGEGRVDSRRHGFTKLLDRVFTVGIEDARRGNQVCVAFIDQDGVENVDKSFVDEESFEEKGDNGGSFAKDKESSINPRKTAVEDCEEGDLVLISVVPPGYKSLTSTWGRYVQRKRLVRTKSDRRALGRRRARSRGHRNG